MNLQSLRMRRSIGILVACTTVRLLSAQTAPTTSPAPGAPTPAGQPARTDNGEVVTLQEFSVSAAPTNDYLSAESITGTRVVSKLRDLPFAVNVVTSDFIE